MSILLETTFGDLVIDLDTVGSPALSKNILKLAKSRYYTNTLIYNVVPGKYCQMGDPRGDGSGGCSIYGLIDSYQSSNDTKSHPTKPPDVTKSQRRFLQSNGRHLSPSELNQKGVVVAMEIGNVPHTIGSQFLITLSDSNGLNDLVPFDSEGGIDQKNNWDNTVESGRKKRHIQYLSLGIVAEDSQRVLSKLNRAYCDDEGRPFADIRIQRALVIHDPFDDPAGMDDVLGWRGLVVDDHGKRNNYGDNPDHEIVFEEGYPLAPQSPDYERPPEEMVPIRIQADDTTLFATAGWDDEDNPLMGDEEEEDEEARQKRLELQQKQEEEWRQRQDTSRAVMLEMLGDLPSADIQAPENVLFVCKLNPLTNDEDLELIFSRFDSNAKAEIIRDPDTGSSLQYAFVEFASNESCNEAYLKMNNALVDDRRIRVDFSQSVAKVWDRYHKRYRRGLCGGVDRRFLDNDKGRSGGGRGQGRGPGGRTGRGLDALGPRRYSHHLPDRRDSDRARSRTYEENEEPKHSKRSRWDKTSQREKAFRSEGEGKRNTHRRDEWRERGEKSERDIFYRDDNGGRGSRYWGHQNSPGKTYSRSPSSGENKSGSKNNRSRIKRTGHESTDNDRYRDRRSWSRSNSSSRSRSHRRSKHKKKHRKERHSRDRSRKRRSKSREREMESDKDRKKRKHHHSGRHRKQECSDSDDNHSRIERKHHQLH